MLINMRSVLFCLVLSVHIVNAGWNEDFDIQSALLSQSIHALQNPKYLNEYEFFTNIREILVNDSSLADKIIKSGSEKLKVKNKKLNVIIKKRRNNHIHDVFGWELSYLLGLNKYVLPSFPMEIAGRRVIVQRLESFEFGDLKRKGYSKGTLEKISTETYWKAHILAYLLGFSDLAAANIGVNKKGTVRFFDNEASLIYYNTPFKTKTGFSTGFICQSFDWQQFNSPLTSSAAENLSGFVDSLRDFEENLNIYLSYRPVIISMKGIQHRLNVLRNFNFKKGATFRDFYAAVFPRMCTGLDELNQIVNVALQRNVGYGSTLFFVCRSKKSVPLTKQTMQDISKWVSEYIE